MLGDAIIAALVAFVLSFAVLSGTAVNLLGDASRTSLRKARAARAGASLVIALLVAGILIRRY